MQKIANIKPTINFTRQLSCNFKVRFYSSLVYELQSHRNSNSLILTNLYFQRPYSSKKSNETSKRRKTKTLKDRALVNNESMKHIKHSESVLPIALIDLNPLSDSSTKVLLIPMNWVDGNDKIMKNTLSSLFKKPKNLQQITAFSEALREVVLFQEVPEKVAEKQNIKKSKDKKPISVERIFNQAIKRESFEDINKNYSKSSTANSVFSSKSVTSPNLSLMPLNETNIEYLDRLAASADKALRKCCLQSIQMFIDTNFLAERFQDYKLYPKVEITNKANDVLDLASQIVGKGEPISLSTIIKLDASKLNFEEMTWNKKYPFPEIQSSSLTNITFPINMIRKSYSTRTSNKTTSLGLQKIRSPTISSIRKGEVIETMLTNTPIRSTHSTISLTTKHNASNGGTTSKYNANYDFPFLTNLFGAKELLLSCDAYNKALIEAAKRREALTKSSAQSKKLQDFKTSRPQVTKIKVSESIPKHSTPCASFKKLASKEGGKKEDPCKPSNPNPCKDEKDKLKQQENEDVKRKRENSPTGCISPKCKKEDNCSKLKKPPCKEASGTIQQATAKQAKDDCKKYGYCKNIIENQKRPKDNEDIRKTEQIPTEGVTPNCNKNDACNKQKKRVSDLTRNKQNESKQTRRKRGSTRSSSVYSLKCVRSSDKGKPSGSKRMEKDQKNTNPCSEENKEYTPKCNTDPCKKDSEPSDKQKKKPDDADKSQKKPKTNKKQDPSKKDEKKDDHLKEQEKKDPCVYNIKNKDPLKKQQKNESCGPCVSKKEKPKIPCGKQIKKEKETEVSSKKSKSSSCQEQQKDTKPNCSPKKKFYSTLALSTNDTTCFIKRTFTSLTSILPKIRNKNFCAFDCLHHFSSKNAKSDQTNKKTDLGSRSKCKSLASVIPEKRKPAYNPHPQDGLRKCYPTYDMDCTKHCKDKRQTSTKYDFLKDTDNNKRNGNK